MDNSTANGIINATVKQNRNKAIDMQFYWLKCRQQQCQSKIYWTPEKTDLVDYFTKNCSPAHHKALRLIYLHDEQNRIDMQGCIKY